MPNSDSVIDRLKNYCYDQNNSVVVKSGIIKGINPADSTIVIEKDGISKNISVDTLESNTWYSIDANNNITLVDSNVQPQQTPVVEEEVEVMEEIPDDNLQVVEPATSSIANLEEIETMNTTSSNVSNLLDMKNAIDSKNEEAVNKILETFAIDDKTGAININKAIKIVTDNCTNNVVNCIKNNSDLPSDLSSYDVTGNLIGQTVANKADLQSLIDKSFNAILVYVQAAKLKNIVYNDAQIEAAKMKYATGIQDKLNVQGIKLETESTSNDESSAPVDTTITDIKPDTDIKKAGFADVLILTIIVLVYAAIIINLISKLK